ncbi:hypothetical protein D9753_17380 [Streptomyces dangxiongensis]|uniref:Uncharacterized protein n=1 Tax=Streptomyces dangxiongensis TaxID=1442032 RepID=A0A3G2JDG9_9ACTN|nr:hypothetical protein [Streptomyces dangxiongensis]AYN40383.1 hypothetical protein D9753_17380 [Streptomyces dangxiongensis]
MTPCLRLALRCVRLLLLLLTAAALPAYGVTVAVVYGAPPAHGAERDPVHPSAPGHREQREPALPGAVPPGPGRPGRNEPDGGGPGHDRPGSDRPEHGLPGTAALSTLGPVHGVREQDRPADDPPAAAVPMPSDSASASVRPSVSARLTAEPSRAGSRAGEGRIRPGRPDGPAAEVEGDEDPDTEAAQAQEPETADVPRGTQAASPPPEEAGLDPARPPLRPAAQQAVQQGEGPTEPVLQILPLGTGLVLIGLGLALALLGLRLRRT